MKLPEFLAALVNSPKTLDQARATLGDAKAQLDSVTALFATAGLDLPKLLEAGPDSLKAHLASLDQAETIKALNAEIATQRGEAERSRAEALAKADALAAASSRADTLASLLTAIGFDPAANDKDGQPLDPKAAFAAHVAKEATLLLARDGRPPLAHISTAANTSHLTDQQILDTYLSMAAGDERLAFLEKNKAAIYRARGSAA